MGLLSSSEKSTLKEASRIRDQLYERISVSRRNYQSAFSEIDSGLKKVVLQSSAIQISDMIDEQKLTSLQALYIFIEQTIAVGVPNNYVLDEMFEEAKEQAIKCDNRRKEDLYQKKCWREGDDPSSSYPPFFGVPTSLKQNLLVKGRQTHVGFVSKVNPIPQEDGLFVFIVRQMGFIPFVRSNVPQGCKTVETNNNMFGYSKNPWNKKRTCGGSSGGEAGMVSASCAPIGFGTDIGGSLRFPCAFTGLTTLKPWNRYSNTGNCFYGKYIGGMPIKSDLGALTKTVADLILVNQYLCDSKNYENIPQSIRDPYQFYKPLNMKIFAEEPKLKIGMVTRLDTSRCSKSVERAVAEAGFLLERKGHEIVEVRLDNFEDGYFFLVSLFTFDQKLAIMSELRQSEPLTKEFKILSLTAKIPWLIRKIIIWIIRKKEPRLAKLIELSRPLSSTQIFQKIWQCNSVYKTQIYNIFKKNKLDAILMPAFVTPAPELGEVGNLQYFLSFGSSWNILQYPVGCLPVTLSRADETDFVDQFNDFYTKNIRRTLKGSQNLPVGVQIGSTPYNEQKILYLMKQLEGQVKFRAKYHIPE